MLPRSCRPPSFSRLSGLCIAVALLCGCNRTDPEEDAKQHLARGEHTAAVIKFRNAVSAKPEAVELRVGLADALERTNDPAGMQAQLVKAIELGGDRNQLTPRLALAMLDRGEFQKLIRDYKGVQLSDAGAQADVQAVVAMAYMGLQQAAAAQQALHGQPDRVVVRLAQAQLLAAQNKAREAMALLHPLATAQEASWLVLRGAARMARAAGERAQAVALLQQAGRAAPWNLGLKGELGEALVAAGQASEARQVQLDLKAQAPNFYWTHYLNALLLNHAGRLEDGHAAALRVLVVVPDHVAASLLAASAELRKGDLRTAERRLESLFKQNSDALPTQQLLAQARWRLGRTDEAQALIRRGLVNHPDDATLLGLQVQIALGERRYKDAEAITGRLLLQRPGDATLMLSQAEAQAAQGNRSAAVKSMEQAATAAGADAQLHGRVIGLALRLRDTGLADRLARQALAARPDDAQTQLNMAAVQSVRGERDAAWKTAIASLQKDPSQATVLAALTTLARTPEQQAALARLRALAIEAGTTGASVYLDQAEYLRQGNKPIKDETPLSVLTAGLNKRLDDTILRAAVIDAHMANGEADKALAVAQAGASNKDASAEAQHLLAATYDRLGNTNQALPAFRQLASAHPQRADWRYRLGQLEMAAGRRAEASTVLRALITERPWDIAPYLALANVVGADNAEEALSIARQLAQQPGQKGAGQLLEADVLARSGKPDEAFMLYADAGRAGMSPQADLRRVALSDRLQRKAAAEQIMADTLRNYPTDIAVLGFAASRHVEQNQPQAAIPMLERLLKLTPDNPLVTNDLAWAQVLAGKPEALATAQRAIRLLPGNPTVLDTLGMALAKAGKRDQATAQFRLAYRLAPTAIAPRLHLAEQLLAASERNEAAAVLKGMDGKSLSPADRSLFEQLQRRLDA